jgi:hypothetical protein
MSAPTWRDAAEHPLTQDTLRALLDNEIPAIRIAGFATEPECDAFTRATAQAEMRSYSVARKIGFIGLAHYEYRWNRPKSDYFRDAAAAEAARDAVLANSFDALGRFMDMLRANWDHPVGFAEEEGQRYYGGIIRNASEGVDLHVDWAPLNAPTYAIGAIDGQLGWNFYAQELIEGGDTTVYNAPWDPQVAPGEIPKSYGLERDIIEGAPAFIFRATKGDVVIFNTRNPHEIAGGRSGPGHERISIGSFVGRMPDGRLVLWS